jgi:hypothetical protein
MINCSLLILIENMIIIGDLAALLLLQIIKKKLKYMNCTTLFIPTKLNS